MDKELQNVGTWIQKHAKYLVIVLFVYLLAGTPLGMTLLGTVNPGFPGAYSACYGVNFKDFGSDWTGTNTLYRVQDAQTNDLVSHSAFTQGDHVYWGAGNGPESMTVVHDFNSPTRTTEQQLATETQTNIPLASFNYQNSTPLTFSNVQSWDQGELLQYWNVQATAPTNQTLSNGTILSSVTYTATSQSLLLIPGNFYLSVYIPSGQKSAGTDSGWQEGTWSQVDFWYVIYWYEWLNAYGSVLQANEAPPNIPTNALNRQSQFNLRGGFPLAGWIQGYQAPITTKTGIVYDLYQFQLKGNRDETLAGSQIATNTLNNILAQIQLSPSLTGRQVTLYTQPGDSYSLPLYTLPSGPIDSQAQGLLNSPDFQTTLPAEYFKIGVQTLGTYPDGNIASGWTIYYPTVDYLLRFIFGVYGVHTFVWTIQTAINLGYNATANYQAPPAQWQNRTIITATTAGFLSGFGDWFSNPLNTLQFYFIIIVIVLLIVTVFNPGVWSTVLSRRKKD
jgi:hypothetical protein